MKKVLAGVAALTLIVVGCNDGKKTAGGPGATNSTAKGPMVGQADNTFTLGVPTLSTKIKQGESQPVVISIKRGTNFAEDVALKLDGLPTGVVAEPGTPAIKAGDKEVQINLKAAEDAAIGDFTVKVLGHPSKGADASNEFKITIEKK